MFALSAEPVQLSVVVVQQRSRKALPWAAVLLCCGKLRTGCLLVHVHVRTLNVCTSCFKWKRSTLTLSFKWENLYFHPRVSCLLGFSVWTDTLSSCRSRRGKLRLQNSSIVVFNLIWDQILIRSIFFLFKDTQSVAGQEQWGFESIRCTRGGQTHLYSVCALPQRPVCTRHSTHTQVRATVYVCISSSVWKAHVNMISLRFFT